jgi:sulfonate transport system substrate-binding protein
MIPKSRRTALALSAAVAAVALAGCGTSSGSAGVSTTSAGKGAEGASVGLSSVTLRVGDQVHLVQTLLQASGELRGVAYRLQWNDFSSGPPLLAALSSGNLDAGLVGDTPPVFAAAAHESVKIVAASSDDGDRIDAIVVPPASPITSVAQLKGKRVAVAEGTSGNYMLLAALTRAGLSWDDITPEYLQPPDALAALKTGSIDAWAVWYPFVGLAVSEGARVIETGQQLDPGYDFVVSPPGSLANAGTAAAIGDFLRRLKAAQLWADAHTAEWAASYASLTGIPLSVARVTTTVESHTHYLPITGAVVQAEQQLADEFRSVGLIGPVEVASIVDGRFAQILSGARTT